MIAMLTSKLKLNVNKYFIINNILAKVILFSIGVFSQGLNDLIKKK